MIASATVDFEDEFPFRANAIQSLRYTRSQSIPCSRLVVEREHPAVVIESSTAITMRAFHRGSCLTVSHTAQRASEGSVEDLKNVHKALKSVRSY